MVCPALWAANESTYPVPERVSAHRFRYDYPTTSGSVVVAEVRVSQDGDPRDLKVHYGKSPFRHVTTSLLRGWNFELPKKTSDSDRLSVVVLFRQPQLLALGPKVLELPPLQYAGDNRPPQPRSIIEPSHPPQVPTDGVAVLGVAVDSTGTVSRVTPLFGSKEFIESVREVIRAWKFDPARKGTEPVSGGLVVAVYFPRPS